MNKNVVQAGFTLIEVLVALAIVGLSGAVLFKIISDNLDRARRIQNDALALSLVRSLLAQAQATQPRLGTSSGTLGNGFNWRLDVAPYGGTGTSAAWTVDAVTVAATVTWREHAIMESRTLSTIRVVPKTVAP